MKTVQSPVEIETPVMTTMVPPSAAANVVVKSPTTFLISVPKFRGREIKFLISRSGEIANLNFCEQELLEDPAITSAIDEETEFNALVEEEAALLDGILGER
ncbi:hypothetical protein V8G54_007287 [Vigna mungo]|uniref:Uncharacterized protein n=1 Tax=Vigna mungo TaxID=3915 RepID=A0AAQ3P1G6_VIGMU